MSLILYVFFSIGIWWEGLPYFLSPPEPAVDCWVWCYSPTSGRLSGPSRPACNNQFLFWIHHVHARAWRPCCPGQKPCHIKKFRVMLGPPFFRKVCGCWIMLSHTRSSSEVVQDYLSHNRLIDYPATPVPSSPSHWRWRSGWISRYQFFSPFASGAPLWGPAQDVPFDLILWYVPKTIYLS